MTGETSEHWCDDGICGLPQEEGPTVDRALISLLEPGAPEGRR